MCSPGAQYDADAKLWYLFYTGATPEGTTGYPPRANGNPMDNLSAQGVAVSASPYESPIAVETTILQVILYQKEDTDGCGSTTSTSFPELTKHATSTMPADVRVCVCVYVCIHSSILGVTTSSPLTPLSGMALGNGWVLLHLADLDGGLVVTAGGTDQTSGTGCESTAGGRLLSTASGCTGMCFAVALTFICFLTALAWIICSQMCGMLTFCVWVRCYGVPRYYAEIIT